MDVKVVLKSKKYLVITNIIINFASEIRNSSEDDLKAIQL